MKIKVQFFVAPFSKLHEKIIDEAVGQLIFQPDSISLFDLTDTILQKHIIRFVHQQKILIHTICHTTQ